MKALIKYNEKSGSFEIREVGIPKLEKGEVLVIGLDRNKKSLK